MTLLTSFELEVSEYNRSMFLNTNYILRVDQAFNNKVPYCKIVPKRVRCHYHLYQNQLHLAHREPFARESAPNRSVLSLCATMHSNLIQSV